MQSHAELVSCSETLVQSGGSLSTVDSEVFLEKFPLRFIFELFQRNPLSDNDVKSICSALDLVLFRASASSELDSEMIDYARHAVSSKYQGVRELGAKFLCTWVEQCPLETVSDEVILAILQALGDRDVGVGSSVTKAMKRLCCSLHLLDHMLQEHIDAFKQLMAVGHSAQIRVFEIFLSAASVSESHYQKIELAGVFSPLIREISNYQDPLSCLCAWSLFREIACESTSQWNGADISASICQIIGPLVKTLLKECEDVALLVGVLTAVAPIIGTSPKADEEGPVRWLAGQLLSYFGGVLQRSEEYDNQMVDAVLDAAGQFGMTISGARLLFELEPGLLRMVVELAFSPNSRPETRRASLHSIAALAGADWGQGETLNPLIHSQEAETKLENCLSATAAGIGCRSPGELLWQLLHKGAVEDRIAVYRLLSALAVRPWFAGALCLCVPLFNHLTAGTELDTTTTEWRYACNQRLCLTAKRALDNQGVECSASHRATLVASLPKLEEIVLQGPFRPGSFAGPNHVVATESR